MSCQFGTIYYSLTIQDWRSLQTHQQLDRLPLHIFKETVKKLLVCSL
ncbi:hypothetical protein [Myxosarcina sp. GI1(2024)]